MPGREGSGGAFTGKLEHEAGRQGMCVQQALLTAGRQHLLDSRLDIWTPRPSTRYVFGRLEGPQVLVAESRTLAGKDTTF
jgi:hypothetical protein